MKEAEKMHEVSLMQNVIRVAEEAAAEQGGGRIAAIHLQIGKMAGVNVDSLKFAFDIISKGTSAEGGALEIENVPLRLRCAECGDQFSPDQFVLKCISCGSADIEIISGREMQIDYITVGEEEGCGE
jgi:hydrogenase nickel incorporation protein HypA/HybF